MGFRGMWMAMGLALVTQVAAADVAMKPTSAQAEAMLWTSRILERYRYKPEGQARPAGVPVLDAYLDALDPDRMVFTREDVDALEPRRASLERAGGPPGASGVAAAFTIFERYRVRLADRVAAAKEILLQPMDFSGSERYQRVRTQAPRARDGQELAQLWRHRVKDDYLRLRLAGMREQDIVPTLQRRYDKYLMRLNATTPLAVFGLFMSAYTQSLDPDSRFFTDDGSRDQETEDLVGAGIAIRSKGDLIHVHELARNGAAARSGLLKPGDRILAVATKPDGSMTDVVGWRVGEVAALMRAAPGSTLTLDVLPAGASLDAPRKPVTLVRDRNVLDTNAVDSRVDAVGSGSASYRIGVLRLPTFYQDYEARRRGDKEFRSMSRDVATHLQAFRDGKVDAVLLDLRNNGGGSLDETTRLLGLFVPGAPVFQQRSSDGKRDIEWTPKGALAWDGPVAVLVDRGTAAGAEIVTAALQDHGRAIVLGEPTFGMSTVHTLISLERFRQGLPGELKMTVSQVFRIDGSSFEQHGVTPDIVLPGASDAGPALRRGSAFHAAPVKPVDYRKDSTLAALLPALSARYARRTAGDSRHAALLQAHARMQAQRDKDEVSLNEAERRRLRDAQPALDVRAIQQDQALQVLGDALKLIRAAKP